MTLLQVIIDSSIFANIWLEIYCAIKYMSNLNIISNTITESEFTFVDFDKNTVTYKKLPDAYKENIKVGTQMLLSGLLTLIAFFLEIVITTELSWFIRIMLSVPIGTLIALFIRLISKLISNSIIKIMDSYAKKNGITKKIPNNIPVY